MSIEFRDTSERLSTVLRRTARAIGRDTVTLRELLGMIGEQGLLMLCALLTIPFLLPVSIPGVSTVFGGAMILIGLTVTTNRVLWLPRWLMDRPVRSRKLRPTLRKGATLVGRFDRFIRPRLRFMVEGALVNRLNGLSLSFAALLLAMPLGMIPFTNTLPAYGILCLSVGILQRDGAVVLVGHLLVLATVAYFSLLAWGAMAAERGLSSLLG
jgi:hypothetical protein